MSPKDLLEISVQFGEGITRVWYFHIIVTLALIGWIVTLKSSGLVFSRKSRLIVVFGYIFFCFTIFWNVEYLYDRINDLYEAVRNHPRLTESLGPAGDSVRRFAREVQGISTKIFLPVTAILFSGGIWWLTEPPRSDAAK